MGEIELEKCRKVLNRLFINRKGGNSTYMERVTVDRELITQLTGKG